MNQTGGAADGSEPAWLEARGIDISRGNRKLAEGVSFRLDPGGVVHLRGSNGSGKTSFLRVLAGLSYYDGPGQLTFRGLPLVEQRLELAAELLYIGHAPGVKKILTPRENLDWYERLSAQAAPLSSRDALSQLGLADYLDTPCQLLSAGQQRRVALARLLQSGGGLWVLDEPFTSLDKPGIELLQDRMRSHISAGGGVVLSSHQPIDVDGLQVVELGGTEVPGAQT